MTKAIRIYANGGLEVMRFEDIVVPPPAAGEARVRQTAVGINYPDINVRSGGFCNILSQWCKHLGATVIGTVGSPGKAQVAKAHGCDHTVLYREVDFVAAVKAIVPQGVSAVFDGVGKDTFTASLDCVRPFGM